MQGEGAWKQSRASPAAAAAACSHTGAVLPCRHGALLLALFLCKDVEGMIVHLQPQMGNEENVPHEARGSWRIVSPEGPSNARGPDGRTCIFQSSALLESEQRMCGTQALKEGRGLSLLLQALMQKAAPLLQDRVRRRC